MNAVRFHHYGGPECLEYEEVADPVPSRGEAIVRVEACGVNHFDLDLRAGVSRVPLRLPHILGLEVVGRIEHLPKACTSLKVGQRVLIRYEHSCGSCPPCVRSQPNLCMNVRMFGVSRPGGYAELTTCSVADLLPVGDVLTAPQWAAVQIAFGTAWHMMITRGRLRPGETVLVNAAGSSVSTAALQIAKLAGATVIASAGSDWKLAKAKDYGADFTINYNSETIHDSVMTLTGGDGVNMVVEHVGGPIFEDSLRSLCPGGRIVTCGGHAGEVAALDLIELFRSERHVIGSRTWTRHEIETVIRLISDSRLRPVVDEVVPLNRVQEAHVRLASREVFGKIVVSLEGQS